MALVFCAVDPKLFIGLTLVRQKHGWYGFAYNMLLPKKYTLLSYSESADPFSFWNPQRKADHKVMPAGRMMKAFDESVNHVSVM